MKELTKIEIERIEQYLIELKGKEEYKYYFTDIETEKPLRAWLDGGYYITLTKDECKYWIGVIKIFDKACGFSFIALLKKLVKEYKEIRQWCYIQNKKSMKFHVLLEKKMRCKRYIKDDISIIVMKGASDGKRW